MDKASSVIIVGSGVLGLLVGALLTHETYTPQPVTPPITDTQVGIQIEIPEVTLRTTKPELDDVTMVVSDARSTYIWEFSVVLPDGKEWSVGINMDGTADYKGTMPEGFETAVWDSLASAFPEWFHAHCHADLLHRINHQ